jgi:hypothetical protein
MKKNMTMMVDDRIIMLDVTIFCTNGIIDNDRSK